MSPKLLPANTQGPALCEDDEEDNFDEVECFGGFFDENEEGPVEDEWDDFLFDREDGEGD